VTTPPRPGDEAREPGQQSSDESVSDAEIQQQPGFPREEMSRLIRHLPAYARLAWALARDPRLSKARRAVVMAGAAYVLSPIDAIPGIVPVLGQLDDIAIALAVIRVALDGLKPEVRAQKLSAAGLSEQDLADDIAATKSMVVWLGRSGLRGGKRLVSAVTATGGRIGGRLRNVGGQLGGQVTSRVPGLREAGDRIGGDVRDRLPGLREAGDRIGGDVRDRLPGLRRRSGR
jgi:uncharacterized membrane protein YkvA (DUF1232 family)